MAENVRYPTASPKNSGFSKSTDFQGIGGLPRADDFYETFFNWPQLYLLGGADDLLPQAERHWMGVTAQLTDLGMLKDEYERGYDWFHQSESLLLLYFLCMAAPGRWRDPAVRFAELYVDPAHGNYDPEHRIIRRPHNGSDPGRTGLFDGTQYPWLEHEERLYGFPLDWLLPGGTPSPAREADQRLAGEMTARLGAGDTAVNLASAGLVLNAWILTGEQRYQDWIAQYVGAWRERAAANGGVLPDNVGPDGVVGSRLDGRWYGGHYGWSWPHGWYSVGQAAMVAGLAAVTATGDQTFLDLVRPALDTIIGQGVVKAYAESDSSLRSKWYPQLRDDVGVRTFLVPYRHSDRGWFDYNPLMPAVPVALWHHSGDPADLSRLADLRARAGYDWRTVRPFRSKEEAGHEEPWFMFLTGHNPDYPEKILAAAQAQVRHRLARMQACRGVDVAEADIHLWQQCNPVVTEALVQLTWGGPQVIYNGACSRPGSATTTPVGGVPACPPRWPPWSPASTAGHRRRPRQPRPGTRPHGHRAGWRVRRAHPPGRTLHSLPGPFLARRPYDYGHRESAVTEHHAEVRAPWLTVRLPASA